MDMGYRLQSDLCSLSRPDFLKMFVYKTLFYGVVLHVECKTDLFSYQNVSVKIKMGRCLNFTPILHHKIVISPRNIDRGVGFVCVSLDNCIIDLKCGQNTQILHIFFENNIWNTSDSYIFRIMTCYLQLITELLLLVIKL